MGLLTARVGVTPITTGFPRDWRLSAPEYLAKTRHVEVPWSRSKEPTCGFVVLDEPGNTNFNLGNLYCGEYVALSLRIDRKSIPGSALKLAIKKAQEEVRRARGVERLSVTHRREIAESIQEELLSRAPVAFKLIDLVVHMGTGLGYATTTNPVEIDMLTAAWKETTNLPIQAQMSYWIGMEAGDVLTDRFSQFLMWVAGGRGQGSKSSGEYEIWTGDRAWVCSTDNPNQEQIVITHLHGAELLHATRAAIGRDMWNLIGLRCHVRHPKADQEWSFRLSLKQGIVTVDQIRLPVVVKDGIEEKVLERVYLLDRLREALQELVLNFAADEGWSPYAWAREDAA